MFEILKALLDAKTASDAAGKGFWWEIDPANDGTGRAILKVEIEITDEDNEFVEQFTQLVGG
jgi:hypothetical protein